MPSIVAMQRFHMEKRSAEQHLFNMAMSVCYAEQGVDVPVITFTNFIPVCNVVEVRSFTCDNTIGSIPCDSMSHA